MRRQLGEFHTLRGSVLRRPCKSSRAGHTPLAVKNISPELLNEVTRRLAAEFQPEQVWLFGSHAWGRPDEGSDLDLLVVVPHSDERPVRRAQRAHRCLSGIGVATDILVKTRAEFDRFRNVRASLESLILRRGRLIYG